MIVRILFQIAIRDSLFQLHRKFGPLDINQLIEFTAQFFSALGCKINPFGHD